MLKSISTLDGANESFYHGMMLGLCAILSNQYHTKDPHIDLESLADFALKQIEEKKYDTELLDAQVHSIVKIGIAFCGKKAVVKRS